MLHTKKVTKELKEYNEIISIYHSSFPEDERLPVWLINLFSMRKKVYFLAFFDASKFLGFSDIFQDEEQSFVLYLATDPSLRSEGYGSKILAWIKENSPSHNIALNIETVDKKFDNYEQRLKRLHFYQKNEYFDTQLRISEEGNSYSILANSAQFSKEKYSRLIKQFSFGLYRPKFV